ncbi:MAG: hypothetical protein KGI60_04605 [Patescibacteria group bacterium]|nr:hypothetical protein [Patescibacteria group bacterium]
MAEQDWSWIKDVPRSEHCRIFAIFQDCLGNLDANLRGVNVQRTDSKFSTIRCTGQIRIAPYRDENRRKKRKGPKKAKRSGQEAPKVITFYQASQRKLHGRGLLVERRWLRSLVLLLIRPPQSKPLLFAPTVKAVAQSPR